MWEIPKYVLAQTNRLQKPLEFTHRKWMKSRPDTWSAPLFAPRWECAGPTPESSARRYRTLQTWPPPSPSHTCETGPSCWPWRGDIVGNTLSAQTAHAALSAAAQGLPLMQQRCWWRYDRERWNGLIWGQIHGCWGRVLLAGGAQTLGLPCWVFLPIPIKERTKIINTS